MILVFEQIFILMLFATVGYLLCKTKLADSRHSKLLSCLEVYVFLPATVFRTFSRNFTVEYLSQKYYYLLISLAILLVVVVISHFISNALTTETYRRNVYKYSLTVSNYGYMGYALTSAIFGAEMLLNVMMFALPLSIYIYTAGFCMLTKSKLSLKKLLNPMMISILLGMLVGISGIELPTMLEGLMEKAAAPMSPVSMLLTGMVISRFSLRVLISDKYNYIVSALRLVVFPLLIGYTLKAIGVSDVVIPALMIYSMPCGLNTIVFPRLVGENCEIGAGLSFISSLASIITIPLCIALFT